MDRRLIALMCGVALAALFSAPRPAAAQSTGTQVTYPDDNVRGGAVAARRPGLWIGTAIGAFGDRQDTILRGHGGATPPTIETPDFRTDQLVTTIEIFFATLQDVLAAISANLATLITGGTSG